ncbi:MAG: CPBP family intramembrane glutamic endopeptidase [Paraburkholderia sp.]
MRDTKHAIAASLVGGRLPESTNEANKTETHHITLYLIISFGIAWAVWISCWNLRERGMVAAGLIPVVIAGSFGPFVAAGVCTALVGGLSGAVRFYGRVLDWRMGWSVFLTSVLALPVLAIVTAAWFERSGGLPTFHVTWAELPMIYLWLLVLGGPVAEEFGWSYLSDALDGRLELRVATLVLGVIWALWHLPLFFLDVPGLSQRFIPFAAFLALSITTRFVFSWAYHRGRRSVLSNLLIHNSSNLSLNLVTIVMPVAAASQPRLWCFCTLTALYAVLLWWRAPLSTKLQA